MSVEEIGLLDRWWLHYIYFHPRDEKKGGVLVRPKADDGRPADNPGYEVYRDFKLRLLWPEWMIKDRYEKELAEQKAALEKRRKEREERERQRKEAKMTPEQKRKQLLRERERGRRKRSNRRG